MSLEFCACDCWLRKGLSERAALVLAVVRPESTPNCPEDDETDGTTFSVAVPRLLLFGVRFVPVLVREVVPLKRERNSMRDISEIPGQRLVSGRDISLGNSSQDS